MHNPYCGINSGAPFDGETYIPILDHKRLTGMLQRVFTVMSDGNWHRLSELSARCQGSETSMSARVRDLRKDKFGAHKVDAERHPSIKGLWLYRLDPQQELRL